MGSTWRVYLISAVIACVVAAGTSLLTLRLTAPPAPRSQGTQAGGDQPRPANGTVVLEGVAEVPLAKTREEPSELEVFYKAPFASPPHLTFPDKLEGGVQVVEQKAVFFKLRRIETGAGLVYAKVKWRAEGQPAK